MLQTKETKWWALRRTLKLSSFPPTMYCCGVILTATCGNLCMSVRHIIHSRFSKTRSRSFGVSSINFKCCNDIERRRDLLKGEGERKTAIRLPSVVGLWVTERSTSSRSQMIFGWIEAFPLPKLNSSCQSHQQPVAFHSSDLRSFIIINQSKPINRTVIVLFIMALSIENKSLMKESVQFCTRKKETPLLPEDIQLKLNPWTPSVTSRAIQPRLQNYVSICSRQ